MGLIIIALIAALALGGFSAWRFLPRNAGNIALTILYVLALVALTWCLLLPGKKDAVTQLLKPRFVVALDTSKSMTLKASEEQSDRWTTAQQVLKQPWADAIAAECDLEVFPFSSGVSEAIPIDKVAEVEPEGSATLLRDGLKDIADRFSGLNVAGALLLSDGVDTREAFDDWAADERPFPFYTVRLEPPGEWLKEPDLRIDAVSTARRVSAGWKTELKVRVSGQGTRGAPVAVQVFKADELATEKPVQIPDGGGEREVLFELEHPEVGVFNYRTVVPALTGEANTEDNEYITSVQVVDARNRLLYVEGIPRWDYKFLRRVLTGHPQVSPVIFYAGVDGAPVAGTPASNMTADMTASELAYFKIVIIGNLTAEELGQQRADNLVKFVEDGGSLVLLGGSAAWGENGLLQTSLKQVLPIRAERTESIEAEQPFPVRLSDTARSHPAFAGDAEFWEIIPPVLSVFAGTELSPAAQGLVTVETPQGSQPIVATQRYGQGKVTAILTDSLWRWQLGPEASKNQPYQRFWTQLIAWMLPQEEDLNETNVEIFAERNQVFMGEEMDIHARIADTIPAPTEGIECRVTLPDGREIPYRMAPSQVTTASGNTFAGFELPFTAETAGLHKAVASVEVNGSLEVSEPFSFFVRPYSPETMPRPVKVEVLQSIAEASSGQFFETLEELNDGLSTLELSAIEEESAMFNTLWRNWLMVVVLIGLMTASWGLRKFRNMP